MTTPEPVEDYRELKQEVSDFSSRLYNSSGDEGLYEALEEVDRTEDRKGISVDPETLEELEGLGLVRERGEEYRTTLLGKGYIEYNRPGYSSSSSLGFSDPELLEQSLWDMVAETDTASGRLPSMARVITEELEETYDDLLESFGEVRRFDELGEHEEAILYLEIADTVEDRGFEDSLDSNFIGSVNTRLEQRTDLYLGEIRDNGSYIFLPTHTGELVRVKDQSGEGLDLVRKTGRDGSSLRGKTIGSFPERELEEFLSELEGKDGGQSSTTDTESGIKSFLFRL